jgi:hypothetical protein
VAAALCLALLCCCGPFLNWWRSGRSRTDIAGAAIQVWWGLGKKIGMSFVEDAAELVTFFF